MELISSWHAPWVAFTNDLSIVVPMRFAIWDTNQPKTPETPPTSGPAFMPWHWKALPELMLNQTLTTRLKQGFIIKPSILKESLELIHEPFLWPFCVGCSKNQSLFSRHDLLVGWNLASCSQLQTLDNFEEIFKKPHTQKKPFLLVNMSLKYLLSQESKFHPT